ncbi:hypothetical protein SAPIO_CDS0097 [Scedosporium apiospermum]|uniref:Hsp70 family chaperone n=1 Tax=Pseudallescheria apiosperma TaxID=563466 RepID=A0A084GHI7_PSEDA|nr:uncharacterized protein SAPIO_CDS0097 [Scedosporium apiospermum]KEZ46799.1 hypothetical protein SAPIO_CDS0097 [Scedosporium apiospermum]
MDESDTESSGCSDALEGDKLVIGLDFGTTFSGIAYAFSNDPEKIYSITNWPGGEDRIVPKAPTALRYTKDSTSEFQWGYELEGSLEDKITGLKLLLDPEQRRPYFIPTNIPAELAKLPKSTLDVATDYLRALYDHAMAEVKGEYLDREFLENYQQQFVLTVPAVWSDKAKDMTLRAARAAGISPVEMITEPEAAALYTILSVKNKGLKVRDAIVICDAGGGTVDLVSYEIMSLNPFELKALTAPSGGVCGSLMLNKLFEDEVHKVVGDDAYVTLKKTEAYRSALRDFDSTIKLAFRGKTDTDKYVSFPLAKLQDNKPMGLERDSLTLSGGTLFRIFDPIIREIDKLVTEQVTSVRMERLQLGNTAGASVKAIFLVGGFGSSAYLKDVIEKSNPGVLVVQPKEAWSAIVKGPVMSKLGIGPTVTSTRAAKHYGTSCHSTWRPIRDRGFAKIHDDLDDEDKCIIMSWFISKNDDLSREKKIQLSFYRKWKGKNPTGAKMKVTDELFECSDPVAPVHPSDDVNINCRLKTDLSQVPKSAFIFQKRPRDGLEYFELHYELQIENNPSGLMKFSLLVNDEEYSAVEATY